MDGCAQYNLGANMPVIPTQPINEAAERMRQRAVSCRGVIALGSLTSVPGGRFDLSYLEGE
jgi:hypothetical protein